MRQSWRHLRSQKKFFELLTDAAADETEKPKKAKNDKKDKEKDRKAKKAKADKEPEEAQPSKKQNVPSRDDLLVISM